MSMYNLEKLIGDFANRTMENLAKIEGVPESYEVTQLINSLFGLMILPSEIIKSKEDNRFTENRFESYQEPYEEFKSFVQKLSREKRYYNSYNDKDAPFCNFLKHMRNSIAHSGKGGLHFFPTAEAMDDLPVTEIKEIIFYDEYHNPNKHLKKSVFCIRINLNELKEIIKIFNEIYKSASKDSKDYLNFETDKYAEKVNDLVKTYVPGEK